MKNLSIYIVLTIAFFAAGGLVYSIFNSAANSYLEAMLCIITLILSLILEFILLGYEISIIKTGIEFDEDVPYFEWKANLISGVKYFILKFVYFIIPAGIVFIVGLMSNIPENLSAIMNEIAPSLENMTDVNAVSLFLSFNSAGTNAAAPVIIIPQELINSLAFSLAITAVVAIIVFIIFAIIQTIAQARLAKSDSLGYSLNIIEAFMDIEKIGWGKVIALLFAIVLIIIVVNMILGFIAGYIPIILIVNMIVNPYLLLFASRTVGLLYSDMA